MPGSEEFVQRTVHALEVGELAIWVKRCLIAVVIAAIAVVYLYQFRGLAASQAMDQAQIGRALASGHGWRTNFVRPRAIGQLLSSRQKCSAKNLVGHLQRTAATACRCDRSFASESALENGSARRLFMPATAPSP